MPERPQPDLDRVRELMRERDEQVEERAGEDPEARPDDEREDDES